MALHRIIQSPLYHKKQHNHKASIATADPIDSKKHSTSKTTPSFAVINLQREKKLVSKSRIRTGLTLCIERKSTKASSFPHKNSTSLSQLFSEGIQIKQVSERTSLHRENPHKNPSCDESQSRNPLYLTVSKPKHDRLQSLLTTRGRILVSEVPSAADSMSPLKCEPMRKTGFPTQRRPRRKLESISVKDAMRDKD